LNVNYIDFMLYFLGREIGEGCMCGSINLFKVLLVLSNTIQCYFCCDCLNGWKQWHLI